MSFTQKLQKDEGALLFRAVNHPISEAFSRTHVPRAVQEQFLTQKFLVFQGDEKEDLGKGTFGLAQSLIEGNQLADEEKVPVRDFFKLMFSKEGRLNRFFTEHHIRSTARGSAPSTGTSNLLELIDSVSENSKLDANKALVVLLSQVWCSYNRSKTIDRKYAAWRPMEEQYDGESSGLEVNASDNATAVTIRGWIDLWKDTKTEGMSLGASLESLRTIIDARAKGFGLEEKKGMREVFRKALAYEVALCDTAWAARDIIVNNSTQ